MRAVNRPEDLWFGFVNLKGPGQLVWRPQRGISHGNGRGIYAMLQDGWPHGQTLTIGILGPLVIVRDGLQKVLPRSRKTRGLLAYLALAPRPCRREHLCDLFWDGAADPRGELRWSLAKIRAAIGPWLQASAEGIALAGKNLSVDADMLRQAARSCTPKQSVTEALAFWRGPPLADVEVRGRHAFLSWLAAERESLASAHARLLKAAVDQAWPDPEEALLAARRLVAQEPWNEWGHLRVAQLLERCGRISEARAHLSTARRSLSRELGIPEADLLVNAPAPPHVGLAPDGRARGGGDPKLATQLAAARSLAGALQPDANRKALELLDTILAENADEPRALAWAAWCYAQRAVYNWSADTDRDRREARRYAAAATETGIGDPECLTAIATARMLVGDRNGAEILLDRALRLDPAAVTARMRGGWLANYLDKPRVAARQFRAAIRLAPLDPSSFNSLTGLGVAHFIRRDYAQAIRFMEQGLALNPRATWILRNLVPAYIGAGESKKAEQGVAALVEVYPRLTVAAVCEAMVFSPVVLTNIAEGLYRAGLPRA